MLCTCKIFHLSGFCCARSDYQSHLLNIHIGCNDVVSHQCVSKCAFEENQLQWLNSCNYCKHCVHLCGFSPLWERERLFKWLFSVNDLLHCAQVYFLTQLWICLCFQRLPLLANVFGHLCCLLFASFKRAIGGSQRSARVTFSISRREWEFLPLNQAHWDETQNFWHLISCFETRPRKNVLQSRALRRDWDLLSTFSGFETRSRIPLIWSRFSRREREF